MYFDLFSGKRLTVWNRTWSVLSLRCDILDSTCCPPSPVYTGVCSVGGWRAGHSLILLMLPPPLWWWLCPRGEKDLVAWLSEGDKGKCNSIFSRLWFISQRLLFTFRYLEENLICLASVVFILWPGEEKIMLNENPTRTRHSRSCIVF